MWEIRKNVLAEGRVEHYKISGRQGCLSYEEVLYLWKNEAGFRDFFRQLLCASAFAAYRWETPAVTRDGVQREFEFVLLNSPGLARAENMRPFAEHINNAQSADIVSFPSLGRDAILVVPCPAENGSQYAHLARFVEHAPVAQQHRLWQRVAELMLVRINDKPAWLSTAGAGVAWLHVRIDDRPKYYAHAAYRDMAI